MRLKELKKQLFSIATLRKLIMLLVILQIAKVSAVVIFHNPFFSFDESNTLRIIQQSPIEIVKILSHEQNFPLYYFILHGLLKAGISIQGLIVGQFILWIISIVLFTLLCRKTLQDKTTILALTLFYTFCSTIWYYAFYVRMYMLMFVISQLILLLLFTLKSHNKAAIFLVILVMFQTALHPGSWILVIVLSATLLLSNNYKKLGGAILLLGGSVLSINILSKPNFLFVYTNGVEYLKGEVQGLATHLNNLFSVLTDRFNWLLLLVIGIIFFEEIKRFRQKNTNIFLAFIRYCFYIALAIALIGELNFISIPGRHYANLIIPILLYLGWRIAQFSNGKKAIMLAIFGLVLWAQSESFLRLTVKREQDYNTLCSSIKSLNNKALVSEFHTINPIAQCIPYKPEKVLLIHKTGIVSVENLSILEILKIQAKQGGSLSPLFKAPFSVYLENNPNRLHDLKIQLDAQLSNHDTFAYIVGVHQENWLSPSEMQLFEGHKIVDYIAPSIYIFNKE